ncbi:hypothetical protein ACQKML_19320 [Peribacillus frigoritolerans]
MWIKVWTKITISIALLSIGILIGSFTNLLKGENTELNQQETDTFQELEGQVRFPSNQNEMEPSQMPPFDQQEEGFDGDQEWGKAGP